MATGEGDMAAVSQVRSDDRCVCPCLTSERDCVSERARVVKAW